MKMELKQRSYSQKQGSRGSFVKKQCFQGLDLKKLWTKTRLTLTTGARKQKLKLWTVGSILEKLGVFSIKIWTKTEIVLNCGGLWIYF